MQKPNDLRTDAARLREHIFEAHRAPPPHNPELNYAGARVQRQTTLTEQV